MTEEMETVDVVSIKFRNRGKMYYFDPAGMTLQNGQKVVVETAKGLELGTVTQANHAVAAEQAVQPLRPVVREATADDLRIEELCRKREREAYIIGKQKIAAHGLEMKLVDVECSFEGNKILFFFSSEGRVDFRDLVKDLAGVFRTRIELRQIGVRDEARMLGGLGVCGRPFCCGTFMDDFAPVSTKMAKTQSMSLNPAKISGCCGRLMCCLRYEQAAYEELVKSVPKNGAFVETPDGYGNVTQVNVLRQKVKVKLDGPDDDAFHIYDADEVAAIPGGRPRDGSQPPHILVLKPKKILKEEETPPNDWEMPERLITAAEEPAARSVRQEMTRRTGNRNRPKREQPAGEAREGTGKKQNQRSHTKQNPAPKAENASEEKQASSRNRNRKRPNKAHHHSDGGEKPAQRDGSQPAPQQQKTSSPARGETAKPNGNQPQKKSHRGRHYRGGAPKSNPGQSSNKGE